TEGQWVDAILNLSTFLGFALGAFIGQAMLDFFKNYGMKKYFIFLSIQIIYLLILALSQEILSSNILVFLLGFLAGYELTLRSEERRVGKECRVCRGSCGKNRHL